MKLSKIKMLFFKAEQAPIPEYQEMFQFHGLHMGRLISHSKSQYLSKHTNDIVVFNGNIITKKSGKIWYGDINVTESFGVLKEISNKLKEDLYILREHDARFEKENLNFKQYKKMAVTVITCE